MKSTTQQFLKDTGAQVPIVCGPMYPGSNPELIAAVSEAGGFGVVQPVALTPNFRANREGLNAPSIVGVDAISYSTSTQFQKLTKAC